MIEERIDEQEIEDGEASIYCQVAGCTNIEVEMIRVCDEHYEKFKEEFKNDKRNG